MQQLQTYAFRLEGQAKMKLDQWGINFTEDSNRQQLTVAYGYSDDLKQLINNSIEDYVKKISEDPYLKENRLFLEELHQHLSLILMAEDMQPPTDDNQQACTLHAVQD